MVSSSRIECEIPRLWVDGAMLSLLLSPNGVDYFEAGHILTMAQFALYALHPSRAFLSGNEVVTVFGGPFLRDEVVRCLFGEDSCAGHFLTRSSVSCMTPRQNSTRALGLKVEQGGLVSSSALEFAFLSSIKLHSSVPSSGPLRGGATVVVLGEDFPLCSAVFCKM